MMATNLYKGFSSRSRTVLTTGCVVILAGAVLTIPLPLVAAFVTSLVTLIVGILLLGLGLLLRRNDLRYQMASWLYREYNEILPGDTLQHGVKLTPHGLFGNWRFKVPSDNDEITYWSVIREGNGHALKKSGVFIGELGSRA